MGRLRNFATIALLAVIVLSCQKPGNSASSSNTLSLPDLGVRYSPPGGMRDKTSPASRETRNGAASYAVRRAELLLDMSSDEDDTAPNWHQVWIFVFPRTGLAGLDDTAAEKKMNTALAGAKAAPATEPQRRMFAGHDFMVSEFEQKEPPLVKHAKIFTTVCKGQLLSFVLVSNSPSQVSAMEESLNTLNFSSQ